MAPLLDAAVICTRNRPDDLSKTLDSVPGAAAKNPPLIVVVDASSHNIIAHNTRTLKAFDEHYAGKIIHYHYEGRPSAARQRNKGVALLPEGVRFVHFMDDDVTLQRGYFAAIADTFERDPEVAGVGALVEDEAIANKPRHFWHRFFLLDSAQPGRVLPSGHVSSAQTVPGLDPDHPAFEVEWLSTCGCAFRREVLRDFAFDEALERQTTEDRDLSFRISQVGKLLVQPQARLRHRASPINRADARRAAYERLVNRYRFVQRTMNRPTNYLAFWWAEIGQFLALLTSKKPERKDALQGKILALRHILQLYST